MDRLREEGRSRLQEAEALPEGTALAAKLEAGRIYAIDPEGPALRENEKGPRFEALCERML